MLIISLIFILTFEQIFEIVLVSRPSLILLTLSVHLEIMVTMYLMKSAISQHAKPAFSCSKPTMETSEQCVKFVFKVNNKDTRTTSLTSFWCLYC